MTEQHGPEADAWMVRMYENGQEIRDLCHTEAEAQESAASAPLSLPKVIPLYAVRPKRLVWEGGFAKTHFGIYIVGYWPSLPPDKRYSMQRPGDVEYADFTTESEAQSAAQADYERRAWACFESL